jgi:hypothetical protein
VSHGIVELPYVVSELVNMLEHDLALDGHSLPAECRKHVMVFAGRVADYTREQAARIGEDVPYDVKLWPSLIDREEIASEVGRAIREDNTCIDALGVSELMTESVGDSL